MAQKKIWDRHEQALTDLDDAAEPSTRSSKAAGGASSASPHAAALDIEDRRYKVSVSNNRIFKVVLGMVILTVLVSIATLILGDDMAQPASAKNGGVMGGDFTEISAAENTMKFASLVGLNGVKGVIRQVLRPLPIPGLKPMRGLLMFGPPGCGKTEIVKAAAGEFQMNLLQVSCSKVMSMYIGRSAQNISRAFAMARARQPCILFFDEVDSLFSDKNKLGADPGGAESTRAISEFQMQLSSLMSDIKSQVFVFTATNHPDKLDTAVLRRLEKKAHVPLPHFDIRRAIIKHAYPQLAAWQYDELAEMSYGYSSSDLETVEKEVHKLLSDRYAGIRVDPNRPVRIDFETVKRAMDATPSSVSDRDSRACKAWARSHGGDVEPEDRISNRPRRAGGISMTEEQQAIADLLVVSDASFPRLDDLAGLENSKPVLKNIVISTLQGGKGSGVMLYGPAGTGKSTLVKALARYASELPGETQPWRVLPVNTANILSQYQGASEQKMDAVFRVAEAYQPCIVMFDEMEAMFGRTADGSQQQPGGPSDVKIKSLFQSFMDDVLKNPCKIIVIGTTNYPENFDPPFRRRFSTRMYIPLPGLDARQAIFRNLLTTRNQKYSEEDLHDLAEATVTWSGADIEEAVRKAHNDMVNILMFEGAATASPDDIRPEVLAQAIRNSQPTNDLAIIRRLHGYEFGSMYDREEDAIMDKVFWFFERWGEK